MSPVSAGLVPAMPDPILSSEAAAPEQMPSPQGDRSWERGLLERFVFASLAEQRRARRWNVAFRFAILAWLTLPFLFWLDLEWPSRDESGRHSALVEVRGVIRDGGEASADRIVTGLRAAFQDSGTAGVIVRINSPGGNPVQAGYVSDEIARLRTLHPDIPVYAVISDVAASGGYFIAAAANRIYASESSVVGSIGVLMNGFGFVDAMDKLGVERRLLTAGEHKGFMDPFSPTSDEELAHAKSLLEEVHQHFIETVKRGRGDRLAEEDEIFSGLLWTGSQGIGLGLVDALGSSSYVAREVIGEEKIVDFTPQPSYLEAMADRLGARVANVLGAELGLRMGSFD